MYCSKRGSKSHGKKNAVLALAPEWIAEVGRQELASIICWQAREISRMTAAPDSPFDRESLRQVSPIEWRNIILYGEIRINPPG